MFAHNPKLFQPIPPEVFERTPPHLRVRYMVKRVLNQARQRAQLEALKAKPAK